jgi:photosystem II stability/assembly factor-like uncharacterized protein
MVKPLVFGVALCLALAACAPGEIAQDEATFTSVPASTPLPAPSSTPIPVTTKAVPSATAGPTNPTAAPETPTPAPVPEGPAIAHLSAGQPVTITMLAMLDANTGWAVGGVSDVRLGVGDHILRTQDGGQTWQDVTPPEPAPAEPPGGSAIGFFKDVNSAWVVYAYFTPPSAPGNVIWRTQDGGQTWQASQALDVSGLGDVFAPSDLVFVDDQTGWLLVHVGAGMSHDYVVLYATRDGGQTWEALFDPITDNFPQSCGKTGMAFVDANTGWITGNCNGVVAELFFQRTVDGGRTWQPVAVPPPAGEPADLFTRDDRACGTEAPALASSQALKLVVVCRDFDNNVSNYLYTANSADWQAWTAAPLPAYDALGSLDMLNATTGWTLGAKDGDPFGTGPRQLYQTTDGGATWTLLKELNWRGQLNFVDEQTGWAVAQAGEEVALVQTTDGGKSWQIDRPQIAAQ